MRLGTRTIVGLIIATCVLAAGVAIARDDEGQPSVTVIADYFLAPCTRECQQATATDVFVGRVASRAPGTPAAEPNFYDYRTAHTVPVTLYSVEVIQVLRGSAHGSIIVRQSGIFDDVAFPTLSDGPPLLEDGEVAVFATILEDDAGWYDLKGGRLGHYRLLAGTASATAVAEFAAVFETPLPSPTTVGGSAGVQP